MYVFGNLLQQIAVRKVGAPVFATFICVRLLASVVGKAYADMLGVSCQLPKSFS